MNSSGRPIKRVMAFGSFDILHPGHIAYLNKARGLGDSLVVVVARDSSIRKIKHREPFFAENDRLRIISSLGMVDKAVQ
ncbi:MAG: adenylyltransferase/cytidyltransferase family protein, partial [Candidatus Marsarchaeota archaeon]|nr:adenylyltransferase/cytidyltransferase family protein [Candidatus Marsarchaeota archaeon]